MQTAARGILRQQPLFRCLTDEQLDALLPRGRAVHFGRGEKLIQQGDNGNSMFILVEGQTNVLVKRDGAVGPDGTVADGGHNDVQTPDGGVCAAGTRVDTVRWCPPRRKGRQPPGSWGTAAPAVRVA